MTHDPTAHKGPRRPAVGSSSEERQQGAHTGETALLTLPADWPPLREAAEAAAREHHATFWDGSWSRGGHLSARRAGVIRREARLLSDFTRPATRDHWARKLAGMLGLEVGCTAPEVELEWIDDHACEPHACLTVTPSSSGDYEPVWTRDCSPLALLDPDDDTRLPDGSRLVDAIALLVVCMWVWAQQQWEHQRHHEDPCDHHDPSQCFCKGACGCHSVPGIMQARDHAIRIAEAYCASREVVS